MRAQAKSSYINNYLSLIKFSHTIFALPFAAIGFLLAITKGGYPFSWFKMLAVLACMVLARTAAMAFNRYADRAIDSRNPRTATREIPAGVVSPRAAASLVIISSVLFVVTTWFINPVCFALSPIALLVVLGYSYTKRFTSLSHVVLGLGLSLAPIGAYLAVTGAFALLPILFSFVVLFWVSGFDIIYALQDEDFDKQQKLRSIPVWMGAQGALITSRVLHALSAACVVWAAIAAQGGIFFWLGASLFVLLLVFQHAQVKPHDLSKVNLAFFTANGLASVVFAVFVGMDLII